MAANISSIRAFVDLKNRGAEANRQAGAVLGGLASFIGDQMYKDKSRKFFDSLGDSEITAVESQIAEIDEQIAELEKQIAEAE